MPEGVCWGKEKQREGSGVIYPTADFWGADGRIGPESVGAQLSCPWQCRWRRSPTSGSELMAGNPGGLCSDSECAQSRLLLCGRVDCTVRVCYLMGSIGQLGRDPK